MPMRINNNNNMPNDNLWDLNKSSSKDKKDKIYNENENCNTCENRKYVDGSDDPGVSFKTPSGISPQNSASKVMAHEMEHFSREQAKAIKDNKEVVSNTIRLDYASCPECGTSYVKGGQTRTVTRTKSDKSEGVKENFKNNFFEKTLGKYLPKYIDIKI